MHEHTSTHTLVQANTITRPLNKDSGIAALSGGPQNHSISMSQVVSASPVNHEQKAEHEQRHEKIILAEHDALLSSFPLTKS
jgi:hypothetical protein